MRPEGVQSRLAAAIRPTRSRRERSAAAACRLGVLITDRELRAVQAFAVVDFRAEQVLQAQRIDQQGHSIGLHGEVVLGLLLVEAEPVLESRAAATADV